MYQAALTGRYLFSKVMPLLASLGVALCTLMVLVTWSVMTGFLEMLIDTGRTLAGDVQIVWPGAGFGHYEELVADLEKHPLVESACPMIETFGSVAPPTGRATGVLIRGIDGERYARVTRYAETLWWRPLDAPTPRDTGGADPRLKGLGRAAWEQVYRNGLTLSRPGADGPARPALVMGMHVSGLNMRTRAGIYVPLKIERRTADGRLEIVDAFLPWDDDAPVSVTVFPIDSKGRPYEAMSRSFPVANEFQSGVFEVDQSLVYMPLEVLQEMLRMGKGLRVAEGSSQAPESGESFAGAQPTRFVEEPARVTHVLVKGRGDMRNAAEVARLRAGVEEVYARFAERHAGQVPHAADIGVQTWEDQNATFIRAVKTERTLVLLLFMIISLTAVMLVLSIFWSMVREKTQDIGVLRSLGASRAGVAGVWVCYGLAIGLVGATLGVAGSYLIVRNINPIHDWLGEVLGLVVWDPKVYYFTVIPNKVETMPAVSVLLGGIACCGLGALVPALRAAWMNPVSALRNE